MKMSEIMQKLLSNCEKYGNKYFVIGEKSFNYFYDSRNDKVILVEKEEEDSCF